MSKTLAVYLFDRNSGKKYKLKISYSLLSYLIGIIGLMPMLIIDHHCGKTLMNVVIGVFSYLFFNIMIVLITYGLMKHQKAERIIKYFDVH